MSRTLTVTADVNAVDTLVRMTAQGSITAPSLLVPAGMNKITGIRAVFAIDGLADDGSVVGFIRLGGNAVLNGEQQIMIGGAGCQTVQTGSDNAPSIGIPFVMDDLDIAVRPGDTVDISAEIAGVDPGDASVAVTLIYGT